MIATEGVQIQFREILCNELRALEDKDRLQQQHAQILREEEELEAQLKVVQAKQNEVSKLIFEQDEHLDQQKLEASKVRENIENAPVVNDVDAKLF